MAEISESFSSLFPPAIIYIQYHLLPVRPVILVQVKSELRFHLFDKLAATIY